MSEDSYCCTRRRFRHLRQVQRQAAAVVNTARWFRSRPCRQLPMPNHLWRRQRWGKTHLGRDIPASERVRLRHRPVSLDHKCKSRLHLHSTPDNPTPWCFHRLRSGRPRFRSKWRCHQSQQHLPHRQAKPPTCEQAQSRGPVYINLDIGMQEEKIGPLPALPDVSRFAPPPEQLTLI